MIKKMYEVDDAKRKFLRGKFTKIVNLYIQPGTEGEGNNAKSAAMEILPQITKCTDYPNYSKYMITCKNCTKSCQNFCQKYQQEEEEIKKQEYEEAKKRQEEKQGKSGRRGADLTPMLLAFKRGDTKDQIKGIMVEAGISTRDSVHNSYTIYSALYNAFINPMRKQNLTYQTVQFVMGLAPKPEIVNKTLYANASRFWHILSNI